MEVAVNYQIRDLTGQRFGRWLVLARAPNLLRTTRGLVAWHVRCDCGETAVRPSSLLCDKLSTSCGCFRREKLKKRWTVHGHSSEGRSPTYRSWTSMLSRCTNPKVERYPNYGGRGISVCERWHTFANFLQDMGPKPSPKLSLDRIDNDGNYEPGNCRWATASEQRTNQRRSPKYRNRMAKTGAENVRL